MSISSKKILAATRQEEDLQWMTFLPDTYVDGLEKRVSFLDIAFGPDGSIYLCGLYFTDAIPLYSFESVPDGSVVVKLNADKSLAWAKYIQTSLHSANCIQYMNPYGTKPCIIIGFDYFYGLTNEISLMSIDASDGSIINQIKVESASGIVMKVMDMKPIPSAYDSNNASLLCVGANYSASRSQNVCCSVNAVLDGSGVISAPSNSSDLSSSTYTDSSVLHRLVLNSFHNEWFTVGRNERSSFYELIGSGNSNTATPVINIGRLFRFSDYINGHGMSDVVCDSSGNTYLGHSSGQITKINRSSADLTTAIWRVALDSNSAYKSPVCLALSSDENYLYAANEKNLISKISTSDGSVVAEMAIPCPQMGYRVNDHIGRYRDKEGFKQIKIENGRIYLLLNYSVKSWAVHGNLIIIPESKFGNEFKLENAVALLNADNLATATALDTANPSEANLSSNALPTTTSSSSFSVLDLPIVLNTEIHNDAAPVIFYGVNNGEAGSSSTAQRISPLMAYDNYGTFTFSARENDVSFFHYTRSASTVSTPAYTAYYTNTAGYSLASVRQQTDSYSTVSLVQWKRMGVTPDTSIWVAYSQDATAGITYRVVLVRGLPTTGTPYIVSTASNNNTGEVPVTPIAVSSKSAILVFAATATLNQRIAGASKSSWTEFTTCSPEVRYGSDTYDASSLLAVSYMESAGTFSVTSKMPLDGSDNASYSAASHTFAIAW